METCFRCDKSEKEVRLVDAIYENEMVKVCERCAVTENLPVIRRPTTSQLRESEKAFSVYQRMRKLAGFGKKQEKHETILEQFKKLEEQPELEMPEERKPFNLIENFHWHVARARRNRGLSQRQLGWALGESEAAVKMVEKGELPEDSEKLIKKLEQFFQIKLREITEEELEEERRKAQKSRERFISRTEEKPETEKKDEEEIEIEEIEAEPVQSISKEPQEEDELEIISSIAGGKIAGSYIKETQRVPSRILNFKPEVVKNLTISDLKRMKEEREKAERKIVEEKRKQELIEEVADEMKGIALGKKAEAEREEKTNEFKRTGLASEKEKTDKKEHTPTIYELMERKRERERAQQQEESEEIAGEEIDLEE